MTSVIPQGVTLKEARRWMAADAQKHGVTFVELPLVGPRSPGILKAFRNRHFLVQVYEPEPHQVEHVLVRLSINRAVLDDRGGWLDGITWDQLQAIKSALGYGQHDALEVYPRDDKLVNVANIRHLWIMRAPLPWAWGAAKDMP